MPVEPPDISKLKTGEAGEEWVSYLYRKQGYEIIARNYVVYWKKKIGEIDIICRRHKRLVMVEVKTRTSERFMPLEETVNFHKQRRLRRMAKLFVLARPEYGHDALQIDLALVLMNEFDNYVESVKLIENAIEDA